MTNELEINRLRHKILSMLPFEERMYIQPLLDKCLALAESEEKPKGEWIPISERLPKRNGIYNVTLRTEEGKYSDSCYFDGSDTWHDDTRVNHGREYLNNQIIAWQPLPEPYKETENE